MEWGPLEIHCQRDVPRNQQPRLSRLLLLRLLTLVRQAARWFQSWRRPIPEELRISYTLRSYDPNYFVLFNIKYREAVQPRLRRHGLALDASITWHHVSDGLALPLLTPCNLVQAMVQAGYFSRLAGGIPPEDLEVHLLQFWRNYSPQFPGHSRLQAGQPLRRTIPVYIHGDEGKHFKRSGLMVVSMQSVLGIGQKPFHKTPMSVWGRSRRQAMNIGGHSYLSRFLLMAVPRRYYSADATVYLSLFKRTVLDFKVLERDGFRCGGQTWFLQVLGLKGDLPFMTKTASLERHFLRAARKPDPKNPPVGMCFLCEAGQIGKPYEDFSATARWATEPSKPPWNSRPSFLMLNHITEQPQQFLKIDLWHCFHGGIGADFAASSLVEIMQKVLPPAAMHEKCLEVNRLLQRWIRKGNPRPHSGPFLAERISMTSYQVCPDAAWSKFDDTRIYLLFIQNLLEEREDALYDDTILRILAGCRAANESMATLFRGGLWLTAEQAMTAGTLGRQFIFEYEALARDAYDSGRQRFPLFQKIHYLDHIWRVLCDCSRKVPYVLNPLSESNQMDEATWQPF